MLEWLRRSAGSLSVSRRAVSSCECCYCCVAHRLAVYIKYNKSPMHYLGVLRISLACSLNRHCCILLGSIFLRCMILTADSMESAVLLLIIYKSPVCQNFSKAWAISRNAAVQNCFFFPPSLQQFC
jgi:hypothetical protein